MSTKIRILDQKIKNIRRTPTVEVISIVAAAGDVLAPEIKTSPK